MTDNGQRSIRWLATIWMILVIVVGMVVVIVLPIYQIDDQARKKIMSIASCFFLPVVLSFVSLVVYSVYVLWYVYVLRHGESQSSDAQIVELTEHLGNQGGTYAEAGKPRLPQKKQIFRQWKAVWVRIRPRVEKEVKPKELSDWLTDIGEKNPHSPELVSDIIKAGEADLLNYRC